ncbi:beta-N-acetylhexosaminidase [Allocatelliglobosispora scoriae]|uniref:Beta-N-acetylhexosaminidase n=1 Tax=Allocatelliglobosispora scoriae TaxID=643052 RepID=A0A841BQX4_9ACTN|nr:glycoside hydrolase family 3 protein [Allocatelliglobosispora scoriae]MBB5869788.1 beta-N-acetylhexosaminidase [Allocatelliglobosispora scoriae]
MTIDPGLRRLALRTLLGAFGGRTADGVAIGAGVANRAAHTAPEWAVNLVTDGLAGYCLFGYNIDSPDQVARLTSQLRAARPDLLIATDEEGGDVTRLSHATGSPYPGNAALGAIGDLGLTRRVYQAIGHDLVRVGINVNLAPTVDVNVAIDNPIIGTRSFGDDPVKVAGHAAAAVVGLQSAGVAACAKHFPGHGATIDDSHHGLPTVDITEELLRSRELPPFAAVVAADAKSIMTAHIRVPALTGDDPATFSRRMLLDVLRDEFGFTGVIMTDALEMAGAAAAAGGIAPAAVRALQAGSDLLCIGSDVDGALIELIAAEIVSAITDGRLDLARVEDAAARNADLAAWTNGTVGKAVEEDLGYAAAARAIRIEGSVKGFDSPLVVQLSAGHSVAEGPVPWGLKPHTNGTAYVHIASDETSAGALVAEAAGRPIVIVGRHTHRSTASRELVEELAATHPTAVVEMGWPASWRPEGAKAFVTTYGASHANGHAAASALGLTH